MSFVRFVLALIAFALSMWIIIPGPTMALYALSVVTTELWPIVMILDAIVIAIAFHSRGAARYASVAIGIAALLCTFVPLIAYCIDGPYVPLQAFFVPLPWRANIPAPRADAPLVLSIYGGAWEGGSPGNDAPLDRIVTSWGYRVVALDYPHVDRARWPAQRDAILRQIDALHVKHVALLGHSSGAELAIIAAALRPHLVDAVVEYESPIDLRLPYDYRLQPDVTRARQIVSDLCGGTPAQQPACYRDASPRYAVHAGMPPIMMIAGGRDHLVNLDFQHLLRDKLRAEGVSVTYVELPWADHAFETITTGFHNRIVLVYLRRFLDKYVR